MAKTAAIFWLLDNLQQPKEADSLRIQYSLGQQIRSTTVMLMKKLAEYGLNFDKECLYALSKQPPHSLVEASLQQFGFNHQTWADSLHQYLLYRDHRKQGYSCLPDTVVICAPSEKEKKSAKTLVDYEKTLWLMCDKGVPPPELAPFTNMVLPLAPLPTLPSLLPCSEAVSRAILLWDVENCVNIMHPVPEEMLRDAQIILDAICRYLAQHMISVNTEFSIACLRHTYQNEIAITRITAPYGLKLRKAPLPGEPAEARIIAQANRVTSKRRFLNAWDDPKLAVIISGDGHTLPALQRFKRAGAKVWVISWAVQINQQLKQAADSYITLETVLRKTGLSCNARPVYQ